MKLFTLDEANAMLPVLRTKLMRIQKLYAEVGEMREHAKAAASASEFGGGMEGGADYGVQLKDDTRGLIDFPARRGDRIVLLCWQLDDGEQIEWWHDTDAGFAGRQPL